MVVGVGVGGIVVLVAGVVGDEMVFVVRVVCCVVAFVGRDVVVLWCFALYVLFAVGSTFAVYLAEQQRSSLVVVVALIFLVMRSFVAAVVCSHLVILVSSVFLEDPWLYSLFCHLRARPHRTGYHHRSHPRTRLRNSTSLLVP